MTTTFDGMTRAEMADAVTAHENLRLVRVLDNIHGGLGEGRGPNAASSLLALEAHNTLTAWFDGHVPTVRDDLAQDLDTFAGQLNGNREDARDLRDVARRLRAFAAGDITAGLTGRAAPPHLAGN